MFSSVHPMHTVRDQSEPVWGEFAAVTLLKHAWKHINNSDGPFKPLTRQNYSVFVWTETKICISTLGLYLSLHVSIKLTFLCSCCCCLCLLFSLRRSQEANVDSEPHGFKYLSIFFAKLIIFCGKWGKTFLSDVKNCLNGANFERNSIRSWPTWTSNSCLTLNTHLNLNCEWSTPSSTGPQNINL